MKHKYLRVVPSNIQSKIVIEVAWPDSSQDETESKFKTICIAYILHFKYIFSILLFLEAFIYND